jgi:hypothetical protein
MAEPDAAVDAVKGAAERNVMPVNTKREQSI